MPSSDPRLSAFIRGSISFQASQSTRARLRLERPAAAFGTALRRGADVIAAGRAEAAGHTAQLPPAGPIHAPRGEWKPESDDDRPEGDVELPTRAGPAVCETESRQEVIAERRQDSFPAGPAGRLSGGSEEYFEGRVLLNNQPPRDRFHGPVGVGDVLGLEQEKE